MKTTVKILVLTAFIAGSTSFLSACSTRELLAGGAGAAGGYVVGHESADGD